ncbi:glycine betaine ABC transporter substrate-binding protein [Rhodococcus sp. NPDC060086]|uniref:glycine betaine ABC transporter substrate-binding protein n=1 Tax=Rhodococcus sp. NPDC060086 TaxID=3347055 RepID=UPI003651F471
MKPHAVRLLLLVVSVVVLGACGLVSSSGTYRSAALPDGSEPLAGASVTVSSKSFTEGVVLGKITATYLAAAGADVADLTGAPGSASSRQALLNGDVDIVWEYTGTGWVTYHGQTETIADPRELWERVRELEEQQYDLVWLPPANFDNTYAFAASSPTAERLGVQSLEDIAGLPVAERTFCVDDEFFSRPDGFVPMLDAYGIPLNDPNGVPADNVTRMDAGVIYTSTAAGEPCNFGMVYTTDGRIKNLDLVVLEDTREFFLPYSGTAVIRGEVLAEYPEIAELMGTLSARLTDDVMRDLNGKVDIEGQEPSEVAYEWLIAEGLIS